MAPQRAHDVRRVSAGWHCGWTIPLRPKRAGLLYPAVFLFLLANAIIALPATTFAQGQSVAAPGDLAVTGFSGAVPPPDSATLPSGERKIDETFIDTNGTALKVFDVSSPGGPPEAQLLNAPARFEAAAGEIGQVFGVAMDDEANIYVTATSAYGLNIIIPDADGDGRPERVKQGQAGAQWMAGQFATDKGGGPGSVYKIDADTGDASLFATLPSGPASLGNIAYDSVHDQLYVSNLADGLIYRLDMNGNRLGTFDHGVTARPFLGMRAVPEDPNNQAAITDQEFDAGDPGTWGFADERRRVYGLAFNGGRLYYAVAYGAQIWSVGISQDGSFGDDPAWELDVKPETEIFPVSDIAFDGAGRMIVAERGGVVASYDYTQHHEPHQNRVLRYRLEQPDDPDTPSRWDTDPEEYAIGFFQEHRNTSGGIAIGYGYEEKPGGTYGFGACEGTLWSSGDALRDSARHSQRLQQTGPAIVHGLQGNDLNLVKPQGAPPWRSYFVDYDGEFGDPQMSGHVGDVAIMRDCEKPDLRIYKRSDPDRCDATGRCTFEVEIKNVGNKPYQGPVVIRDTAQGNAPLVGSSQNWNCSEVAPGTYRCEHPPASLAQDQSMTLELTFRLPSGWKRHVYENCAALSTPGSGEDAHGYNNEACDYVPTCQPGDPYCEADLELEKFNLDWNCDWFGNCPYVIRVTNVGAADYKGPLRIRDTAKTPGTTLSHYNPSPPWNCGPIGAGTFECTHSPVTLAPGEFRELVVWVSGPPLIAGHIHVRNCAWIEWNGRSRDIYAGNEYACSEIPRYPPGHRHARPRLRIEKKATPNCSKNAAGNWECGYLVVITNVGGKPYLNPFKITDTTTGAGPATLVFFGNTPPWNCNPGSGAGGAQTCTRPPVPGGLQPGDSVRLELEYEVPAGAGPPPALKNCAETQHDNDGDGVAETIDGCAIALICDPAAGTCPNDLAVLKLAPSGPCYPGFKCPFDVQIKNLSSVARGPGLPIIDKPNPDAGPLTPHPGAPLLNCAPAGPDHNCTLNHNIPAGSSFHATFEFFVPNTYKWTTLKNCVSIPHTAAGNALPFNDEDCASAFIAGPDLTPWSPSECRRGEDCPLRVEIRNDAPRPFKGAAGLKGSLNPPVTIKSIDSQTAGLDCNVTSNGAYECQGANLNIEPHGAAVLRLVAEIPADFEPDQIKHTKTMLWPKEEDKDRNEENDQHSSIIEIVGPKEPEEEEEPPEEKKPEEDKEPRQEGAPDLAVSKTANDNQCKQGKPCGFTVTVKNVGNADYTGPLTVSDTFSQSNARLLYGGPGFSCSGTGGGGYTCQHPNTTLKPGDSISFTVTFKPSGGGNPRNCAAMAWGGGAGDSRVLEVQKALNEQGFQAGPEDGQYGPKTAAAIRRYQRDKGLPVTGQIDNALLSSLFGEGDGNPQNDRACASVPVEAAEEPQPRPCSGGRVRTQSGACVCPRGMQWIDGQCREVRRPQPCSGGRVRNDAGNCVCPRGTQWTGDRCIEERRQRQCTGGRVRTRSGECVCPRGTQWTGERCIEERRQQQCSGGRVRNDAGQCVCPGNTKWTGVVCIPDIIGEPTPDCSGGRVYNKKRERCECPPNKPVWNGEFCAESRTEPEQTGPEPCTGGRERNRSGQCVCPGNTRWNGEFCAKVEQTLPPQERRQRRPRQDRGPQINLPGIIKQFQ